jgi:hypothetical protein
MAIVTVEYGLSMILMAAGTASFTDVGGVRVSYVILDIVSFGRGLDQSGIASAVTGKTLIACGYGFGGCGSMAVLAGYAELSVLIHCRGALRTESGGEDYVREKYCNHFASHLTSFS